MQEEVRVVDIVEIGVDQHGEQRRGDAMVILFRQTRTDRRPHRRRATMYNTGHVIVSDNQGVLLDI